jgi:hypothetical protein
MEECLFFRGYNGADEACKSRGTEFNMEDSKPDHYVLMS